MGGGGSQSSSGSQGPATLNPAFAPLAGLFGFPVGIARGSGGLTAMTSGEQFAPKLPEGTFDVLGDVFGPTGTLDLGAIDPSFFDFLSLSGLNTTGQAADLLNNVVAQYESRFGSLTVAAPAAEEN